MSQKDLSKAAFAVGFGFTFGRVVGETINSIIIDVSETLAKHGSKSAQHIHNKAGIKSKENKETETDRVIDFRFG